MSSQTTESCYWSGDGLYRTAKPPISYELTWLASVVSPLVCSNRLTSLSIVSTFSKNVLHLAGFKMIPFLVGWIWPESPRVYFRTWILVSPLKVLTVTYFPRPPKAHMVVGMCTASVRDDWTDCAEAVVFYCNRWPSYKKNIQGQHYPN